MKIVDLNSDWTLQQITGNQTKGRIFHIEQIPCQVHDVLIKEGVIENPNIHGINYDTWIGENDWCYEKTFYLEDTAGTWNLILEGLDTFADVYVNGQLVAENKSVYMSCRVYGLSELIPGENRIRIDFKSPVPVLREIRLPEKYQDFVPDFCKARVFRSGFISFSGPIPSLIRMGIYGKIRLEQISENAFQEVSVRTSLDCGLTSGSIWAEMKYQKAPLPGEKISYTIKDEKGSIVEKGESDAKEVLEIKVEAPDLWWPRFQGKQTLYEVEIILSNGNGILDVRKKKIGFRSLMINDHFDCTVNGRKIKLWGVNLTQVDTVSGCYHREKMNRLLSMAELANCNCLRVWAESEILQDEFYEECDRRGFLVWQDFYVGYNMYNVEDEIMPLYEQEAVELVNRLKHHPCILLWCGGNEVLLSRDYQYPGQYCYGEILFKELYPKICGKLDPERYYHVNCPYGGTCANDPREGDSHGYTHQWYVPGVKYPVFLSENARFSAPALRTMKRMLTEEELWPAGYNGQNTKERRMPWPETWENHCCGETGLRLGPVEHYYDPDCPEALIYNLGAAYSEYIKKDVERFRRGKPDYAPEGERITKGHLLWKLNNCSNLISYGLVDYFDEPQMAYYALKKAYEPLQISFSIEDSISLWIVNDTAEYQEGTVTVLLFDLGENRVLDQMSLPYGIHPDESRLLTNLDSFGQFRKDCVLVGKVYDRDDNLVVWNHDFVEIEKRLDFSRHCKIQVRKEEDTLVITTDKFARSVELQGDNFGWLFEDNYFDLIPGMEKRVRILCSPGKGTVRIKPYYNQEGIEIKID